MRKFGNKIILLSCGLFCLYFANVLIGSLGMTILFTDIQEMLTMCLACIVFVIGILQRESEVSQNFHSQSDFPEEEN